MFNSGVLDVAIGLTLVFVLVSTVCTAVREAIESRLKTRAAYLEYAIRQLLNEPDGKGLAASFFQHPMISGLFQNSYKDRPLKPTLFARGGDMPSYIPARNFAVTLIDIVARGGDIHAAPSFEPLSVASLRENVSKLPSPFVQRALLSAIDAAQGDLEAVRAHLEVWFDAAMDRVSGWYKRATQTIIFGVALIVTLALNVNAITIADRLYHDQALRSAAVIAAETLKPDQRYDVALETLDSLHLPIGWEGKWQEWCAKFGTQRFSILNDVITPCLGLLLTALAATLGAPFWFDVLNKVMVIRATVKPHEKSPEEGSKSSQDSARVAAPVVHIVTGEGVQHASASAAASRPHELDGCDVGSEHQTPDEALPPATGGVL